MQHSQVQVQGHFGSSHDNRTNKSRQNVIRQMSGSSVKEHGLRAAETRGRYKDEASVEEFLLRIINDISRSLIISYPFLQGSI